ncbi:MAG TPA: winged helix-turn-helix domain-containing protein [Steroidobacteraceae bacterium]
MHPPLTPENRTTPPRYRIGDLEVDIGKAEVTRGDEKVALPKLSFDLLCALINAAPAIVTNDDLLAQVWPGLLMSPESVAQRVKLLRSAIGDDSQHPRYILGVRGRGYRLIPLPERLAESSPLQADAGSVSIDTPNILKSEAPASQPEASHHSKQRLPRMVLGAAALVTIGICSALGWRYWSSSHHVQPASVAMADKSIAVLPFVDMSEKKDQEYFGDGMAQEIIDILVTIPGLRVIGRTSSFQFKGKTVDLRTISEQLGVANVLEGSVRKSGDRVRVTAQLIDSHTGATRWSQTYDRDFIEVLKLQDEIATRVAREVEANALFSEILPPKILRNVEAYTAFLRAIDATDAQQQVIDLQQAFYLDPTFAGAASALAGAYLFLGEAGLMPAGEAFGKARHTADRALELDPNDSGAHEVLGEIYLEYDWDWAAAEREFKLAKTLAFHGLGSTQGDSTRLSLTLGRWDDAVRIVNKAVADDPLDPQSYLWLGIVEIRQGRLPEAEAALRRNLELDPAFNFSHYVLAVVLLARGELQAALAESLKEPIKGYRLVGSAMAYSALGLKSESDAALVPLLKIYSAYIPSGIAAVYTFRGEKDDAFKWLDRAYAQKDPLLYRITFSTEFDALHDDPRYKAFLKKMKLPE